MVMIPIPPGDTLPACTDEGFLQDAQAWNEGVAMILAQRAGIAMTESHWEIVCFIRDYQQKYQHLPNMRMFVKALGKSLGQARGNSHYLHQLFPETPLKKICQIAGLPKPPGCL